MDDAAMSTQENALGNFPRGSGHACQEQAACFRFWNFIRGRFHSTPAVVLFFLLTSLAALYLIWARGSPQAYGYLLLVVMAGASFYAGALGDGGDYRRHLFLFHFLFDCCFCCAAITAVAETRSFRSVRSGNPSWGRRRLYASAAILGAVSVATLALTVALNRARIPPSAKAPFPSVVPVSKGVKIDLLTSGALNTPRMAENNILPVTSNFHDISALTGNIAGAALSPRDYIFAHANSRLEYMLEKGRWTTLSFAMGLDDFGGADSGSVIYIVKGDGKILFQSPVIRADFRSGPVSVNIRGVDRLELITTDAGDGVISDEAYWIAPRLQ